MIWMLTFACHLHSGLNVPAGERFVLGDNPHGNFRVRVANTSPQPVTLETVEAGAVISAQTLAPGETLKARFAPAQSVSFVNDTAEAVQLSVDVRGDVGLSMGYTPLP